MPWRGRKSIVVAATIVENIRRRRRRPHRCGREGRWTKRISVLRVRVRRLGRRIHCRETWVRRWTRHTVHAAGAPCAARRWRNVNTLRRVLRWWWRWRTIEKTASRHAAGLPLGIACRSHRWRTRDKVKTRRRRATNGLAQCIGRG